MEINGFRFLFPSCFAVSWQERWVWVSHMGFCAAGVPAEWSIGFGGKGWVALAMVTVSKVSNCPMRRTMSRFLSAAAVALLFNSFANAALPVQPSPGVWGFDAELNGKPGRGFQLDKQGGDLLVLSYFGYRADGSAVFLQASGVQVGNGFEGDLVEYQGGTALGGSQRDAELAGSAGKVAILFDSPTVGSITLPGEQPQRISRLQYENLAGRFNNSFSLAFSAPPSPGQPTFETQTLRISARNGEFTMSQTPLGQATPVCQYTGTYVPVGDGIESRGTYSCANSTRGAYRTQDFKVNAWGFLTGLVFQRPEGGVESAPAFYAGVCLGVAITGFSSRCAPEEINRP
ncbi:hypothetical protein AAFF27_10005 [Xylophilus sp. GW821-FHT01B05]